MGYNLIHWTPMGSPYFLVGSILEKCGTFEKNCRFSGQIWPDGGNTAWVDTARLGSTGLRHNLVKLEFSSP